MARFFFLVLVLTVLGIVSGDPCLSPAARTRKCDILKTLSNADKGQKPVALCVLKTCLSFPANRVMKNNSGQSILCIDNMGLTKAVNEALQLCLEKGDPGRQA